jgi:hypothetical protein
MYMFNDRITGTIPTELGSLGSTLKTILLYGNPNLTGSIPTKLCEMARLQSANLTVSCDIYACDDSCACACFEG